MPQIRLRSLVAALFGLALIISACSGSDSTAGGDTDATSEDASSTDDGEEGDDGDDGSTVEPSALGDADGAVPDLTGPVDPSSILGLVEAVTGAPPSGDELTCLAQNTEGDSQLTEVFNGVGTQGYEIDPEGFTALAVNTHECVEQDTLLNSLATLSVLEGEGADEFRTCMTTQIGDEVDGDLTYTGLVALLVGFPIPEGATEFTFDAVTTCVTTDDLAEQIGLQGEIQQNFNVAIDRECVADGLDEDAINEFWSTFILQVGDSTAVMELLETCAETFTSDLLQELPVDFEPWAGINALAEVDPAVRNGVYSAPPPNVLEDGVDYQALLTTTDGEFTIDLFEETAPITVNNFVALAQDGFYDSTTFHRVLANFMAQAGDPTGTGSGGPGYSFDDEESALTPIDRRGLLAMANAGANTNGSQFFITFEPAENLNGLHAVFGEVIEGDSIFAEVDLRDPTAPTSRGEQLISVEIIEG